MNILKEAIIYGFFFTFLACNTSTSKQIASVTNNDSEKLNQLYQQEIKQCINICENIKNITTQDSLLIQFKKARLAFKKLEPLMGFFNAGSYKSLNRPNLPIVDEDDNAKKVINPTGFQVLEEVIMQDKLDFNFVKKHSNNIISILKLELNNHSLRKIKDHQIIWMFKDAYLRVMALGISGFDSPILLHSIPENKEVFNSLTKILKCYKNRFTDLSIYKKQLQLLEATQIKLATNNDFNGFDRYDFVKNNLHPLLKLLNQTATDWNVDFPFNRKLNNNSESFFSQNTFNLHQFSPNYNKVTPQIIDLGKNLFYDNKLSHNKKMSCFSCHQPEKAFTDGLQFSKSSKNGFVSRNAPTLLYSGLQAAQFYDARAASLETQIIGVVNNEKEFHNNLDSIVNTLKKDSLYVKAFNKEYEKGLTTMTFRHAIASYIRTLSSFNSKFDQNISGVTNDLTQDEIKGFNLFMGKAKCATCHFAPTFNGTVPPYFNESELEVLGIPKAVKWENASIDNDLGRYNIFKTEKKKHAFKTPTVRNSSKTSPYMHNGIYNTLDDVIKFYNLGGGAGIGITLENQTLPSDKLNLEKTEIKQLIKFLNSLEDYNES